MTAPPRTAELLLESLGADRSLSDAVLGDMAEEFAQRVRYDGPIAARCWYWSQTLSTMPHLLRAWTRDVGMRDVARLAGVVVTSYVLLAVVGALATTVTVIALGWLGVMPIELLQPRLATPLFAAAAVLGAVMPLAGGYVAAWLDERTPLVSATALGVVWSVANVSASLSADGVPVWFRVLAPFVLVIGAVAGGVLRVRARAREAQPVT